MAKKVECFHPAVAAMVDFVLTFEELAALFKAAGIDPADMGPAADPADATASGRAYPVAAMSRRSSSPAPAALAARPAIFLTSRLTLSGIASRF